MDRTGLTDTVVATMTARDRVQAAVAYQHSRREAWQECLLTVTTRHADSVQGADSVYFRVAGERHELEPLCGMADTLGLHTSLVPLNTNDELRRFLTQRDKDTEVNDAE